ncbi:MAG: helix-turn-helix transcriptional regulator [Lachnospirales bacterium]
MDNYMNSKNDKTQRTLSIYTKLLNGYIVNKAEEATNYNVNERSIQRDIDDIRNFLEVSVDNFGMNNTVIYDRLNKGYKLERCDIPNLTNSEILALSKILLDNRAFTKNEMNLMVKKLVECCVPKENQNLVYELISNEAFHYVEPRHKTVYIDKIWSIGQAIKNCQYIEFEYLRLKDKKLVKRKVKPLGIMFSEFYFYLTAVIDDEDVKKNFDVINDSFPTIYRIDKIHELKIQDEKFHIPYSSRFEDGEFKKRIQFMYGSRLRKIKFEYFGLDVNAVLDRLPTATIISEDNGKFIISAEVFGNGVDMWLKSQESVIKLIN